MFVQNVRSIRGKLHIIEANLNQFISKPDIIILSETWLTPDICNTELGLGNYNIYRCDRKNNDESSKGGGVLVGIDKSLQSGQVTIEPSNIHALYEHIFVKINSKGKQLILGAFYIPPNVDRNAYKQLASDVESLYNKYQGDEECSFMMGGDFNIPHVQWCYDEGLNFDILENASAKNEEAATIIKDCFSTLDLYQHHPTHSKKEYTLDLMFAQVEALKFSHQSDCIVPWDAAHHESATFSSTDVVSKIEYVHISRYNFKKIDTKLLNHCVQETNWISILDFETLEFNDCINLFYSILYELVEITVPKIKFKLSTYPKWYSRELIEHILFKKSLHKKWKETKLESVYIEYKKARAECLYMSRVCQAQYISFIENSVNSRPRVFWKYVNELKSDNDIPQSMVYNNEQVVGVESITSTFANHLKTVFKPSSSIMIDSDNNSDANTNTCNNKIVSDIKLTVTDITNCISKLKPSSSYGPDLVPSIFIKKCKDHIALPLFIIFTNSLKRGIFPDKWKISYVRPLHKDGSKGDIKNYRPISTPSCIPKMLDELVNHALYEELAHLVSRRQHGFVKGRSVVTNMLQLSKDVIEAINRGYQVDTVYIDVAKAYDTIDQGKLLIKLQNWGVRGNILRWLESYLKGRYQVVNVNGVLSDPYPVTSGVAQGSHLAPLLFNIYINDLVDNIEKSRIDLFADDSRLYKIVKNHKDVIELQNDINKMMKWYENNNLDVNVKKCNVITFSRSKSIIEFEYRGNGDVFNRVKKIRDLGVILDERWTFDDHLRSIISKAHKTLGFIKRSTFKFKSFKSVVYLYKTLIVPIFMFASQIWAPHTNEKYNMLNGVVRKVMRYISVKSGRPMAFDDHAYYEISKKFNICKIESLHEMNDMVFIKKLMLDEVDFREGRDMFSQRVVHYELRCSRPLVEERSSSELHFNSTINRIRRLWNALPVNLREINDINVFKKVIRNRTLKFFE